MESRLHGVPLSAANMAPKAASSHNTPTGIRAPLTVDDSDSEYSVSSKSHRYSPTSSYYSGSEVESEGFVSGEDESEIDSERPYVTCQDEEILEETLFVEEYEISKPSVNNPSGAMVQESSNRNENGFSRPSVKSPDGGLAQERGNVSGNPSFTPFVRSPDERIQKGMNNSTDNESDDSRPFLSESGELVADENYTMKTSDSRSIVAAMDEDVTENELTLAADIKIPVERKVHIPIAQVSWDSDNDSQESVVLDNEGFSGVVRVPSIEVLHRVNSAPRVSMSEEGDEWGDNESHAKNTGEMEFAEELVISNGALGHKDDKEHIGVEDTIPDINKELNEANISTSETEQNGDIMHLDEEVQENDVIDEQKICVDLVDHKEPSDLAEAVSVDDGEAKSSSTSLVNPFFNQDIESGKVESESEHAIDHKVELFSSNGAHEIRHEVSPEFPELPVALAEHSSLIGVSNACESVFKDTTLDQESKKEFENTGELCIEVEKSIFLTDNEAMIADVEIKQDSTSLSGGEVLLVHSLEIDGHIVMDTDEKVDADGMENLSLESDSADAGSSMLQSRGPIIEARNPDLFVPPLINVELQESLSKRENEKTQQIQLKYFHSPEDSVAMELQAPGKGDVDFSLCILVIGKTGVGKSATINSIFGGKKTEIDAFEPATNCVREIIGMVDGIKLKIFDTPGLRASVIDQSVNRKILSSIKKVMHKSPPDVILYVDRLDIETGDLYDLPLLKSVTSCLGSSIWQKSIIVLTHAASLPPDGPEGHPLSYETFVAQRSRVVQQLISRSSKELPVMNRGLLILVENHPLARKNRYQETLVHDGESWRPQLLFLCCSMKALSEVSPVVPIHNPVNQEMGAVGETYMEAAMDQETGSQKTIEPPSQLLTRPDHDWGYDGVLTEDKMNFGSKQLTLVRNSGFIRSQDDEVCGVRLDFKRDERHLRGWGRISFGLSVMRCKGDLLGGCNVQSQFAVGRNFKVNAVAGLNSKRNGQIHIKMSCSDQLHIAALALIPIAKAMFKKVFQKSTEVI